MEILFVKFIAIFIFLKTEEFKESCKDYGIAHFNKCVQVFKEGQKEILYTALTPDGFNYNGYQRGTMRCFVWTEEEGWSTLFSNAKAYRGKRFLSLRKQGRLNDVEPCVIENYLTNGYSTRFKGLLGNYSEEELERMGRIGRSHADYMGNETGNSTIDHYNRVALRR